MVDIPKLNSLFGKEKVRRNVKNDKKTGIRYIDIGFRSYDPSEIKAFIREHAKGPSEQ